MDMKLTAPNPSEIDFTLEITMTLGEWCKLKAQLPESWPAFRIGSKINEMVVKAESRFYPKADESTP